MSNEVTQDVVEAAYREGFLDAHEGSARFEAEREADAYWNLSDAKAALSQTDEQPDTHDMTDAECATAYRDLRKRANDAGFATVGEWIDEHLRAREANQ